MRRHSRSRISVSLSADGSVVAIGSDGNDGNSIDSGHVRIYQNVSNTWTQIGDKVRFADDRSVISLSLSGNGSIVAIGAYSTGIAYSTGNGNNSGHVRIYKNGRLKTSWGYWLQ
jgi:hypothetical protein